MARICDAIARARPGAVFSTHAPDDTVALERIAANGTPHAVIGGVLVEWLDSGEIPQEEELLPLLPVIEEEEAAARAEALARMLTEEALENGE